jgi:hypothetical protein
VRLLPALAIIDKNFKTVGKEVSQCLFTAILSIVEETIILATALILAVDLGFLHFSLPFCASYLQHAHSNLQRMPGTSTITKNLS